MPKLSPLLLSLALALASSAALADPQAAAAQALAAAEAAINVGNDSQAESWLSRIPANSLAMPQMARAQVVRAQILLKRGQPLAALQSLPSGSDHVPLYADAIEATRARALFALGDPVAAVRSLVLRERYLRSNAEALADNRERIWDGLKQHPPEAGDLPKIRVQDAATRGWLELFQLWRQGSIADYAGWSKRYPGHPGERLIAGLRSTPTANAVAAAPGNPSRGAAIATGFPPAGPTPLPPAAAPAPFNNAPLQLQTGSGRGYALLLPLSGPYMATGEAVRDGFMAAAQKAGLAGGIRVYDTGADASQAVGAYRSAVAEGAGVVVGPLHKESVAALARLGTPEVPLLGLNALDANTPVPSNFLQFGLAPEDEARAAASQAIERNQRRALALVPSSDWGNRVLIAFRDQFTALGGTVVAAEAFASGSPDPSKVVKKLLNFDTSEARHKALSDVIGKQSEFDARRRSDVDFVFLAAKPTDSRLILPQLRFYRASNLPIVSTSLIYEGRGIDWPRMSVCDMPLMTQTQGPWALMRSELGAQYVAPMRDYPRLVALGHDAFGLARKLVDGSLHTGDRLDGASGQLIVAGDGRIARELSCSAPTSTATVAVATP